MESSPPFHEEEIPLLSSVDHLKTGNSSDMESHSANHQGTGYGGISKKPEATGALVEIRDYARGECPLNLYNLPIDFQVKFGRMHYANISHVNSPIRKTLSQIIDFSEDRKEEMTYSRRLALFLMKYNWYYKKKSRPQVVSPLKKQDAILRSFSDLVEEEEESNNLEDEIEQPQVVKVNPISLEKAWEYFEHVTLPRYLLKPTDPRYLIKCNNTQVESGEYSPQSSSYPKISYNKFKALYSKNMDRVEPGESDHPTALYPAIFTPFSQLGDFGLGIGLYFYNLRAMAILIFLVGLVSYPTAIFYQSDAYQTTNGISMRNNNENSIWLTWGSAICFHKKWVPCPNCTINNFETESEYRFATAYDGTTAPFALKNMCTPPTFSIFIWNFLAIVIVTIGIIFISKSQDKHLEEMDMNEQTTQDYSVMVSNPPRDAYDPEEWKFFFEKWGHVTSCTVALANDQLLEALVKRREIIRSVELLHPPGTVITENYLARSAAQNEVLMGLSLMGNDVTSLFFNFVNQTARARGLAQLRYPVHTVFIVFETEKAQRQCLTDLNCGKKTIWNNETEYLPRDHIFKERVLEVNEAPEPSEVRWIDLNVTFLSRVKLVAYIMSAFILVTTMLCKVVVICHRQSAYLTGFVISGFNTLFPYIAQYLTTLEKHASEGHVVASIFLKVGLFRILNTVLVVNWITPFTSTLDSSKSNLIPSIAIIFYADIITSHLSQLLDISSHIKRHVLAPRAMDQDAMNLKMTGTWFDISIQFSNYIKIVFLTFFYGVVYPEAYLLAAVTLVFTYSMDKFSLMRSWRRVAKLGPTLATYGKFLLFCSLLALVTMSAYAWSGFPYDNLCKSATETVGSFHREYLGNHTLYNWTLDENQIKNKPIRSQEPLSFMGPNSAFPLEPIQESDAVYYYCNQDLLSIGRFPPLPRENDAWMTDEQRKMVTILGLTSLTILLAAAFSGSWALHGILRGIFGDRGTYKACGEDMKKNFSNLDSKCVYIPQANSAYFSYPLLACDVRNIDEDLLEWNNPYHCYSYYNLTLDLKEMLGQKKVNDKFILDSVTHWPPNDTL
eukprot:CAMPEP_0113301106 /NCGR_PEP_ID=MMETSP0010_2-20120614/2474_1 /TAXON_ID=216773 ORGANISM="Corethron hystrix, Strain 308" /NCGR_SAMPLE_ID=MMETSP0010_2 /ASSEMBLY_ACC=CAM_ASM_000155 /LENGTH=1064 /DNA_ID=CAMNT_0000154675 /DNA_START=1736 /DNA_END=4930 /DNA_ORIENTATION=+ /assembly_acc=CAM_ASM_000155